MRIQMVDLHFTYPGGVKALNGVSLTIEPGEQAALVGENGSGKTTLARHLNGLLQPQSGKVFIGDWDTAEYRPAQMARRVAYVFQNPDEQLFRQRIWDEVAFGPQNLGYSPIQVKTAVDQALQWTGLEDLAQVNPRDLGFSGRKRIAIACALAMQTPIVVLDEPTAGLDSREQDQLAILLSDLRQQGRTVLLISHDMDFIAENMGRFILLHRGQVLLDAPGQDFFKYTGVVETSSLLIPQMTRLSQALGHKQVALSIEQFLTDRANELKGSLGGEGQIGG